MGGPAGEAWEALALAMRGCTDCAELAATRTHVVVGQPPSGARVVLVGEAPGAAEDATGEPFVGASGQLLDRLLAEAGLPRTSVGVLNTLKCRPPGNRPPSRAETLACRRWTQAQLDLTAPDLVVTLGLSAARWFLGPRVLLRDVRGVVHEVAGRSVLPTYHPSAALRWGPGGEPARLLRQDLALAARLALPRESRSPGETRELGRRLAGLLRPGDLVVLSGPLGAGKTALTQGVAEGLGVAGRVTSPTFVLARVHRGPVPLVHVDAYRLRDRGPAARLELDDLDLDASLPDSVTVVEWGEGLAEGLADSWVSVELDRPSGAPEDVRSVSVSWHGPRWSP